MNGYCAVSSRGLLKRSPLAIATILFLLSLSSGFAQDTMHMRPDWWVQIQDSCWMYRVSADGDTLEPDWFSAMYRYEMLYDSTCVVTYHLAECKRNGVRLYLPQWKDKRVVNADGDLLSFNSRTANFPLRAGDTLSFYREFSWYHPRFHWTDSNNYYARDSLDFAVELVNAKDSLRLELLDSIGALSNSAPGRPALHGTRPIFALVRYVVPSSLTADSAFIRLRLYARGSGDYYFTRHDLVGIGMSKSLESSYWTYFTNRISGGFGKRIVRTSKGLESTGAVKLDVVSSGTITNAVEIRFDVHDGDEGSLSVVIFDARGETIFYPYTGSPFEAPTPIVYSAPRSGTYFAALLRDGEIVATRKFIIAR